MFVFLAYYLTRQKYFFSSYPIDKWAHFAVTWNRTSKEMKVYINQKVKTSKIATHVNIDLIDTGNTKYILGNNGEFHLNGWMSDFYVFKNALTKTQISKVAGKRCNFPNFLIIHEVSRCPIRFFFTLYHVQYPRKSASNVYLVTSYKLVEISF